MNRDLDLAIKYCPEILLDSLDPFEVKRLGYTVFSAPAKSPSSQKFVTFSKNTEQVIEYAVYYDFDIQHMYDLEHVWVEIDAKGELCGCHASFHGSFLNMVLPDSGILENTNHIRLFSQPGKHAFLPEARLMHILPDLFSACGSESGGGILVPYFLSDQLSFSKEINDAVKSYIKNSFSFIPSMEFHASDYVTSCIVPWESLLQEIPSRINKCVEKIQKQILN